jgi:hypothetical protein
MASDCMLEFSVTPTAFLIPDYGHIRIGFMISLFYHSEPRSDPKKIHAPESRPITRK